MAARVLVTLGVLVYGLVVPFLEINATHVFDPLWPPHARLHEVWQLSTNSAIGLLSLWLAWSRREVVLASVLAVLVTGGFLVAFAGRALYGGSMVLSDGTEKMVLGLNLGVVGFVAVLMMSLTAVVLDRRAQAAEPGARAQNR